LKGTFVAHVEGGSGRPEASPTAILQDTHSVEGYSPKFAGTEFSELSRVEGLKEAGTTPEVAARIPA
jgi:hypothetical protein